MNDKIHILLVIWHPVGGIRTFLRYVYGQFSPAQYRLVILLPETSELNATKEDLAHTDTQVEILPPNPSKFAFWARLLHILKKQRIDIVHSQGFTSGVLAAFPARLFKIPHLLTSHDVLRENQFRGLKGKIKKTILSFVLSMPDMIHSVSNDAQGNLLNFFPRLKKNLQKLCVIQNGVESKKFLIDGRTDLKKKNSLPKRHFLIGFFGRFMRQKGFDILINAVEILAQKSNYRDFSIAAFGWGGFIREEQAEITRRNLTEYFTFMPFEPNIAQVLRGVDVVVMPSRWEACPLLPMEALIAGVPLIGTDCLGLREVLHNTPGIIIPKENPEALAEALDNEMHNNSAKLIEDYRNQAADRFDVHKQIESLRQKIQELIDGDSEKYKGLQLSNKIMISTNQNKVLWLSWEKHRRTAELCQYLGITPIMLVSNLPRIIRHPYFIIKSISILKKARASILIVQNPSIVLTLIGCIFKYFWDVILIVDAHNGGIIPDNFIGKKFPFIYRIWQHQADLTIISNSSLANIVLDNQGTPFVLPDKLPDFRTSYTRWDFSPEAKINVLYIATFENDEPYNEVFNAVRSLPDNFHIYVTGNLKKIPASLLRNLPAQIKLTNFLSETDYWSLLCSVDLVIDLTNRENCLLCGAYEAISQNKPLVLSSTHALKKYFGDGAIYTQNDSKNIHKSLLYAVNNINILKSNSQLKAVELREEWHTHGNSLANFIKEKLKCD